MTLAATLAAVLSTLAAQADAPPTVSPATAPPGTEALDLRWVGARFVTACPAAPAMPAAQSPEALRIVGTLVEALRSLPDVRRDRVALFGHSRGAGAALHYVLERGGVQGAVLNSGGYPHGLAERAAQVRIPLLILHGVADGPADGGSEMTGVQMARDFEAALRRAGASVDAHYYEGGGHNGFFTRKAQYEDEVERMRAFLRRHLE